MGEKAKHGWAEMERCIGFNLTAWQGYIHRLEPVETSGIAGFELSEEIQTLDRTEKAALLPTINQSGEKSLIFQTDVLQKRWIEKVLDDKATFALESLDLICFEHDRLLFWLVPGAAYGLAGGLPFGQEIGKPIRVHFRHR